MTLKERYSIENNVTLISMIDDYEVYTPECRRVVKEILKEREINEEDIKKLAIEVHAHKARAQYQILDPVNDAIRIFPSEFLSPPELKDIYIKALDQYIKDREGFRYNVWFNKLKEDL